MKKAALLFMLQVTCIQILFSQQAPALSEKYQKAISHLIDQYSKSRENRDTALLKTILTSDIDQLVSTGEWRLGIKTAIDGMMKSSATSPGTRTLSITNMQMINSASAIVDCRYEIQATDGSIRKMWSTFIVVLNKENWKIRAIRNMLPSPPEPGK